MYTPTQFNEDRLPALHDAILRWPFATLITHGPDGITATHLPILLDPDRGPNGTLLGHVAAPNPQGSYNGTEDALVIFSGPNIYVTPNWYPSKKEHGRVAPTWNYVAVHAYGPLKTFTDPDRLRGIITRLTDTHEAAQPAPWRVSDAPEQYVAGMIKGIVGLEIPISRLEGKWKMSQNRPAEDRQGVMAGLRADGGADAQSVADIMATLSET